MCVNFFVLSEVCIILHGLNFYFVTCGIWVPMLLRLSLLCHSLVIVLVCTINPPWFKELNLCLSLSLSLSHSLPPPAPFTDIV